MSWKNILKQHFSHPAFNGQVFTEKEMLDEFLSAVEHGIQHESRSVAFDGLDFVVSDAPANLGEVRIPLSDLSSYGYVPKKKQKAEDFLQNNWNCY